jgi:hypothetical protein
MSKKDKEKNKKTNRMCNDLKFCPGCTGKDFQKQAKLKEIEKEMEDT